MMRMYTLPNISGPWTLPLGGNARWHGTSVGWITMHKLTALSQCEKSYGCQQFVPNGLFAGRERSNMLSCSYSICQNLVKIRTQLLNYIANKKEMNERYRPTTVVYFPPSSEKVGLLCTRKRSYRWQTARPQMQWRGWPPETRLPICVVILRNLFIPSQNGRSVTKETCLEKNDPRVPPLKVTQGHRKRHVSIRNLSLWIGMLWNYLP